MNHSLQVSDYEKIIHFASVISQPSNNIRYVILKELAEHFGYKRSIFWKADNDGNLTDPIYYGTDEQVILNYVNEFYKYDFLHPQKNLALFRTNKAIKLFDLVHPSSYEQSIYYQNFMKPYHLYDQMVVTLVYDNKIIGALGLARQEACNFQPSDCKRFRAMIKLISTTYHYQMEKNTILLSERERDVVSLVKEGKTNLEIAEELFITDNTVKKHLQNIYRKSGVRNKIQLVQIV